MPEPSLIPRTGQDNNARPSEPLGVFFVLGILVLAIVVAALVGVIFYKQFLEGEIEAITVDLKKIEDSFKESNIEEWARVSQSMEIAKSALAEHLYISSIFTFLEENTIPNVRFSNFNLNASENHVTLDAKARNYTVLAQQKEIFEKNSAVASLGLSNFMLTPNGGVDLALDIIFNDTLIKIQ